MLKRNQECNWCEFCGKNCHNIWYGMFLCSVITRYHCNHPNDYNEFDAVRLFRETYINLFEFEDYLESRKLEGDLTNYIIPECMLFDSLIFALNSVEWSVMWGHNINSVDSLKTIKMNNSSDNGEHEEEVDNILVLNEDETKNIVERADAKNAGEWEAENLIENGI